MSAPKAELWQRIEVHGEDTRLHWMVWTPRAHSPDGHCEYFTLEQEAREEYARAKEADPE